jgi:hypothetical protein
LSYGTPLLIQVRGTKTENNFKTSTAERRDSTENSDTVKGTALLQQGSISGK